MGHVMKTDARVRYTKMMIQKSFVSLMKEMPLNKITVTDVCKLAQINRATFYKHYLDCFDLMGQLENQFIEEIQEKIDQSFDKGLYPVMLVILEAIEENAQDYLVLFSQNGDPRFASRLFSSCFSMLDLKDNEKYHSLSLQEREWLYYFIATGISGILGQWIESGMKADKKEVAAFIQKLSDNAASVL